MRFFENVKNMKKHHSFEEVFKKKTVMVNGMFLLNKK